MAEVPLEQTLEIGVHGEIVEIMASQERSLVLGSGFLKLKFDPEPSEETRKVLQEEFENCQQLLELEPESKWTNYTKAMLMKALDSNKHFDEILAIYENLKIIDLMRRNYYDDQKSKLIIEKALEKCKDFDLLDLTAFKLTKIYYKQYLNLFVEVKF